MLVRRTEKRDIDKILLIIEAAREYFREAGIPQWQGEYPSRKVIEEDMARGESYVCECGGEICAFCAIVGGIEPDYVKIYEGKWKNDREYLSLHRVAVSPTFKGQGVGAAFVSKAVELALERPVYDIKCDTHRDNASMRRMLEKNGFEECGIIYLVKDGEERIAYQKVIDINK